MIPCPGLRAGRRFSPGFTLLELIVVMAVIGTVLVLTLPRLSLPGIHDDLEAVARQLIGAHHRLKTQAAAEQRRYTLHIDLDRQRMWISDTSMDENRLAGAAEDGYDLPRSVRLDRLRTPGGEAVTSGTYGVQYFPDGHSFMVDVDLRDSDGRRLTLRIEPFLSEARVVNEDGEAIVI
jgi:prepilin-type N-terminal cleavage/methylation domain-containing protein